MAATTSRLSLTKPGGGSTGLITPPDPVDIDVLNANFDKIDSVMGLQVVTSVTRPASPFDGQPIFETDTKRIRVYRQSGATWDTGDTQRGTRTAYLVADLTALDLIADAIVGDTAFMTTPGTGIDSLKWEAYAGTGAGIDWRVADTVVADTKANLDTFIAAVAAIADTRFKIGSLAFVTTTPAGMQVRFTTTAGAYRVAGNPTLIGEATRDDTNAATSGTTYADVTGLSVTGTSTGGVVRVTGQVLFQNGNSGLNIKGDLQVLCDGALIGYVFPSLNLMNNGDARYQFAFHAKSTPAAGSHTWKLQAKSQTAGAMVIKQGIITVEEIGV